MKCAAEREGGGSTSQLHIRARRSRETDSVKKFSLHTYNKEEVLQSTHPLSSITLYWNRLFLGKWELLWNLRKNVLEPIFVENHFSFQQNCPIILKKFIFFSWEIWASAPKLNIKAFDFWSFLAQNPSVFRTEHWLFVSSPWVF